MNCARSLGRDSWRDCRGLAGRRITDPLEPTRQWTVQWLLAPVHGRRLGGVRAKLVDSKGFVSFINQRDLEVLLGHGRAGEWCAWLDDHYVGPSDRDWYGICCDEEDLRDDLFERECLLRQQNPQWPFLPTGLEIRRRVHVELLQDAEELHTLLGDVDMDTGAYPDPRLQTVSRRWARVERNRLIWERVYE
jgi:hypothetical protein